MHGIDMHEGMSEPRVAPIGARQSRKPAADPTSRASKATSPTAAVALRIRRYSVLRVNVVPEAHAA
jgi:hypothetical protein